MVNVPMLVTEFLRRGVKLYANRTAVVCGEKRFSYAQFAERVNRLGNSLRTIGIRRSDRVAFLSFNCHRLLEAYYGVTQIGAILVPLNIRLKPQELAYVLNDAGAKALFVDKDLLELIRPIVGQLATVRRFVLLLDGDEPEGIDWPSYDDLLGAASPDSCVDTGLGEDDVAEIFYTSGTTGKPKGVMLTHRNLYANALSYLIAMRIDDSDVLLHSIPLFHVNGWGAPHSVTCTGGKHVMMRQFSAERVFALIEQERVTWTAMVPTMVISLLNSPDSCRYNLASWNRMVIGGAPCPVSLIRQVSERFGIECFAGYGTTESSPVLAVSNLKSHLRDLPSEEKYRLRAKTGLEVIGVELRVVNERGEDVKNDGTEIGEIIARGNNVMKGYWRDPEATNRVLADGWLHTGDMATVDEENYILIVDRKKDIIISGGENISSVEIEDVLHSHPAVLEAAVIGVPDPFWGEVPKALVVLKPGQRVTEEEVVDYCRGRLAGFKIPKSVDFLESLPKTGTGKIMKSQLRDRYWGGYDKRV